MYSLYQNQATEKESPKMYCLFRCKKPTSQCLQSTRFHAAPYIGPTVQICRNSGLPFHIVPWLHQSILYIKRQLREWRAEKCNPCFGAKSLLRSTGLQSIRFYAVPYRETVQISGNSGLTFAMAPWLHQFILYIKGTLREWRAQKCNPCFGAKSPLRSKGLQSTRFHSAPYRPTVQIWWNSGLPFAMVPWLHQCILDIKRKLREWRACKCNPCFGVNTVLRSIVL